MKDSCVIGDEVTFKRIVEEKDIAAFEGGVVHEVYSTFSLARDAEWTCRQFVLKMKEEDEEGIGTFVNIRHVSPALLGSEVVFKARIYEIDHHAVNCKFEATVNERIIAEGEIGQKILLKEKVNKLFKDLEGR
ncbi:MAG: hypothetical protein HKN92_09270 [Chitinophagales bacterium]|nr:hypothetical protein [Chitinophagales bacterium]